MRIALDYDKTYTVDHEFWLDFILLAQKYKHVVYCVTMRHAETEAVLMPCLVIYTERKAKKPYCEAIGLPMDVWIDDSPQFLLFDAAV